MSFYHPRMGWNTCNKSASVDFAVVMTIDSWDYNLQPQTRTPAQLRSSRLASDLFSASAHYFHTSELYKLSVLWISLIYFNYSGLDFKTSIKCIDRRKLSRLPSSTQPKNATRLHSLFQIYFAFYFYLWNKKQSLYKLFKLPINFSICNQKFDNWNNYEKIPELPEFFFSALFCI